MAVTKFDHEAMLATIKSVLTTNLNARIAAIEAEKIADGFPTTGIQPIDTTNGYFEQTWSDSVLNQKQAVFYGIERIDVEGIGAGSLEKVRLFVEIVLVDAGNDKYVTQRVHRYSRAIKEVFENYFLQAGREVRAKIETVVPTSFKLDLNSSDEVKVGGVALTLALS